ncbi:10502_t:CDS:1, partial [Funneliformis geosporum]
AQYDAIGTSYHRVNPMANGSNGYWFIKKSNGSIRRYWIY